eukprot:TRINITY_DN94634_c0_g1_i1.p1 TRINITY_DN94634_c0_g1~~TRINITY_DN94634_c0_g1_i1.p1  ORF type:complete len:284 (-),score=45.97 TRINITY_DN94634_c0_g1_i1:549-1400(-)
MVSSTKEAVGAVCFMCGFCGAGVCSISTLVGILLFMVYTFNNDEARAAAWVELPWSPEPCKVISAGVARRGCKPPLIQLTDNNWMDCTEEGGKKQEWTLFNIGGKRQVSTECIDRADRVWELAAETQGETGELASEAPARQLSPSNTECKPFYVPWVLVELPGGEKRCSYRWGAEVPSIERYESDAEQFVQQFLLAGHTTCYIFPEEDCVVALQHPDEQMIEWFDNSSIRSIFLLVSVVAGSVCVVGCLLGFMLGAFNRDSHDGKGSGDEHSALMSRDFDSDE